MTGERALGVTPCAYSGTDWGVVCTADEEVTGFPFALGMAEDTASGTILVAGYLSNPSNGKLMLIDASSFTSLGTIDLGLAPLPAVEAGFVRSLSPIVVDETRRRAWVATRANQTSFFQVGALNTKQWLLSVDLDRVLP